MGSGLIRLTSTQSAREYSPAWSPDGKRIAFESNVSGSNEIYVMNVDGSNPTRLVSLPDRAESTDPAWSPDSTRVAFTIFSRPQGSGIDTVNADGSDLRVIVPQTGGAGDPAWALDGSRLVFSQLTPAASPLNIGQLFSLNIDGTNLVQLTNELMGENDQAIFSPDGTRIAFRSSRDGNNEIYVANGVGGDQQRVTRTLGDSNDPTWQPVIPPPPPPPPPPPRATNVAITKAAFTSNGSRRLLELSGSMTPVDAGGNVQITVSGLVPTHSKKKHGKVKSKNKLVQVKATAAIANGKWLTKLKLAKTFAKVRKVTIEVTYPGAAGTFLASPAVKKTVALKKAAKKHGRK